MGREGGIVVALSGTGLRRLSVERAAARREIGSGETSMADDEDSISGVAG